MGVLTRKLCFSHTSTPTKNYNSHNKARRSEHVPLMPKNDQTLPNTHFNLDYQSLSSDRIV